MLQYNKIIKFGKVCKNCTNLQRYVLLLQPIMSHQVVVRSDDVKLTKAKIINITHFLAEYFAQVPRVFAAFMLFYTCSWLNSEWCRSMHSSWITNYAALCGQVEPFSVVCDKKYWILLVYEDDSKVILMDAYILIVFEGVRTCHKRRISDCGIWEKPSTRVESSWRYWQATVHGASCGRWSSVWTDSRGTGDTSTTVR